MKNEQGTEPKFKVGDRVEVDNGEHFAGGIGRGVVLDIDRDRYVHVRFFGGTYGAYQGGCSLNPCEGMTDADVCNECKCGVECRLESVKSCQNKGDEERCSKCRHRFICWTNRDDQNWVNS